MLLQPVLVGGVDLVAVAMALAESYFYIGEHYLNIGDNERAQAYFEKTRNLGVIIYTEHAAAKFELARMKNQGPTAAAAPPADNADKK